MTSDISVLELFTIGIGPSSSHTVGPMRAARRFAAGLREDGRLGDTVRVRAELFGSLGATGHGHGSDKAVLLGLAGEDPESVDTKLVEPRVAEIRAAGRLLLAGVHEVAFDTDRDLVMHRRRALPFHPNGMIFTAYDVDGAELVARTYYSVGGGFVVDESAAGADRIKPDDTPVAYPFRTGVELLTLARDDETAPLRGLQILDERSHPPLRRSGCRRASGGGHAQRRRDRARERLDLRRAKWQAVIGFRARVRG